MGRSRDKGDKPHTWKNGEHLSGFVNPSAKHGWKRKRKAVSERPEFEVTGQHVIIFVALVFAAAWFAGLLPDP